MQNLIAVFIGGGLGSLTRFAIGKIVNSGFDAINPKATFISNILSSIILAITIYVFSQKFNLPEFWRLFIVVGFCGGFSTFSSFSFENVELLKSGFVFYALANIFLSIIIIFGAVYFISK